jgi:hypothetical protein
MSERRNELSLIACMDFLSFLDTRHTSTRCGIEKVKI